MPIIVKNNFYDEYSKPDNYVFLTIKKNKITNQLINLYNNNILNLKNKAEALSNNIQHNKMYDAFKNGIYLLDYKSTPTINSINVKDFLNFKYKGNNVERTELNYINTFKSWISKFFQEHHNDTNFNWFVVNQNEVLLKLLEYRSKNNQSIESLRKDINLLLKILKLSFDGNNEIIKKYKLIQMNLSKMHESVELNNELSTRERNSFVTLPALIKIRDNIYNKWLDKYETTGLDKYKNPQLRIENMKCLLLSFYVLFPPSRNEVLNLELVKTVKEAKSKQAAILIKDNHNIIIYYNDVKKNHQPLSFNLNDEVIKSFSKNNVDTLIETIIESVTIYPREYLFINKDGNKYTEKGLQKMLYELIVDKNIGVNALRSSYVSYWIKKLNATQATRVAYLMRTSTAMLYNSYFKQQDDTKQEDVINNNKVVELKQTEEKSIKLSDDEIKDYKMKLQQYNKMYYENNRERLLQKANDNNGNRNIIRIIRELRQGKKEYNELFKTTIDKYKIKFNEERNMYISELQPDY